jgi:hypothetical protein
VLARQSDLAVNQGKRFSIGDSERIDALIALICIRIQRIEPSLNLRNVMSICGVILLHARPSRSRLHLHKNQGAANGHSFAIWLVSKDIVDADLNF